MYLDLRSPLILIFYFLTWDIRFSLRKNNDWDILSTNVPVAPKIKILMMHFSCRSYDLFSYPMVVFGIFFDHFIPIKMI